MLAAHATLNSSTHSAANASVRDQTSEFGCFLECRHPFRSAIIPHRASMSRRHCTSRRMTATPVLQPTSCARVILHLHLRTHLM